MDKNKQFEKRYGEHNRWDWDDEAVALTFSDPENPTLRIDVTVVGTTQGDSWEWSWANPNFEARSKLGMDQVRDFGQVNGYQKMVSAFLDADDFTGWEMTAVAAHLLNSPGAYRFPTAKGHCYLIYRNIEEIPKPADPPKRLSTNI